jgi:hypothetical protein
LYGPLNGKMPLLLTLAAAAAFITILLIIQPYSTDWPGGAYAKPAKGYIRAALRQDSAELADLSASSAPVAWALAAARLHGESLALWTGRTQARIGPRSGDTIEVFLYPSTDACSEAPIQFQFIGSGKDARVLSARSSCLDGR